MSTKKIIGMEKTDKVFLMDPDKVILNEEKNGRVNPHDDEAIDELVQSFKAHGQLQAVVGRKTPDGHLEIVLGFRRTQAMRKLNEEMLQQGGEPMLLQVRVAQMNDMEAFKANIVENLKRRQTTSLDHAHNQNVLRLKHHMTNVEIAAFYDMNPSRVSQLSRLLTLNEGIKQKIHAGEITMGDAFALTDLTEDQQLEVVKEQEELQRKFIEEEQEGKADIIPSEIHHDNMARVDAHEEAIKPKKKAGRPKGTGKGTGIKEAAAKKAGKGKKSNAGGNTKREVFKDDFIAFLEGCVSSDNEGVRDICAFFLSYCNEKLGSRDLQETLESYCQEHMPTLQEA